jgi:3-methyl-2-oxobutanoate hydroxymethyltransferase
MAGHETTFTDYFRSNDIPCLFSGQSDWKSLSCVDLPFEVTSQILKKPCVHQSGLWRKRRPRSKTGRWKRLKNQLKILNAGIPVMGHLGLTPQSIYKFGVYRSCQRRGRSG